MPRKRRPGTSSSPRPPACVGRQCGLAADDGRRRAAGDRSAATLAAATAPFDHKLRLGRVLGQRRDARSTAGAAVARAAGLLHCAGLGADLPLSLRADALAGLAPHSTPGRSRSHGQADVVGALQRWRHQVAGAGRRKRAMGSGTGHGTRPPPSRCGWTTRRPRQGRPLRRNRPAPRPDASGPRTGRREDILRSVRRRLPVWCARSP